jgi:flavin reductase (DIM6/NTAB) family NADH-FMN oxidoreductase RutF
MYFGTPVLLISTVNEDGSPNLAPMSSAWWLGASCMLGLDVTSQTTINPRRTGELVINLAHSGMVGAVDRLADLTGTRVVPPHKQAKGYRFHADEFAAADLTPAPSDVVSPPRVQECRIQQETVVDSARLIGPPDSGVVAVDARIVRTHVVPDLLLPESDRYIDPDLWDPLIMKCRIQAVLAGVRLDSSWNTVTCSPPGAASPASSDRHGVTVGFGQHAYADRTELLGHAGSVVGSAAFATSAPRDAGSGHPLSFEDSRRAFARSLRGQG